MHLPLAKDLGLSAHLELQNAIVHVWRHAVRHGHHNLDGEEARLIYAQADFEAVLEGFGQERDMRRVVAVGVSC